ncbi:MAG: hypothetical protein U0Q19_22910 [Kineosporiaceae bacterium]
MIKKYDKAATPATRLARDHPDVLTPTDTRALRHQLDVLNPAGLARRIAAVQASLLELARRRGSIQRRAKANAVYLSKPRSHRTRSAVVASRIEVPGVIVASLIRALLPPSASMIAIGSQSAPDCPEGPAISR